LEAGVHYVGLKKDYSNIHDVVERIKDRGYIQKLVDSAYEYSADSHTYSHRVLDVWKAVS
jgi:microsomal dipeptidase-like Zn-dependent dipeptidase